MTENYQWIGKVKRSFGKDGQLSLTVQNTEGILAKDKFLFVSINGIFVPFKVESVEQTRGQVIVKFYDYDTEEKIKFLIGEPLYTNQPVVTEEEVTDNDLSYFVGFTFTDKTSGSSGTITDFYDYRNNPLWGANVSGISEEVLIPCVEEFILAVNPDKQHIEFNLPEGLLTL